MLWVYIWFVGIINKRKSRVIELIKEAVEASLESTGGE